MNKDTNKTQCIDCGARATIVQITPGQPMEVRCNECAKFNETTRSMIDD